MSYFFVIRTMATTISTIRPTATTAPRIHIQHIPPIGICMIAPHEDGAPPSDNQTVPTGIAFSNRTSRQGHRGEHKADRDIVPPAG